MDDSPEMNSENSYEHPTCLSSLTDLYLSSDLDETIQNPVSMAPQLAVSHKKRAGRKKFKETRHPTYRGVRLRKNDKWVCEIREPNSKARIWLGTHSTPEKAARAYDVAVLALRGNSAPLNFEDSLWLLPRAKSSSPKDIQSAAAKVNKTFPLRSNPKPSSITPIQSRLVEDAERASNSSSTPVTFYDDEELYYMPALISSMAEGMLLDPPQEGYCFGDEHCDFHLWNNASV